MKNLVNQNAAQFNRRVQQSGIQHDSPFRDTRARMDLSAPSNPRAQLASGHTKLAAKLNPERAPFEDAWSYFAGGGGVLLSNSASFSILMSTPFRIPSIHWFSRAVLISL